VQWRFARQNLDRLRRHSLAGTWSKNRN
jgi:hypothetical protein